jgi:pyrroline-5-carboxylate reductase
MVGSANMVMKELNIGSSGKHIMQMKDEVCSLAGTAIAGVSELEKQNVRGSFIKCIEEATSRAKELSK